MSFNRLNYDSCTYKHDLRQSQGTGEYVLNTPAIDCKPCFKVDSSPMSRNMEFVKCKNVPVVDVSSELLGLNRKASNCPDKKYLPGEQPYCQMGATLPDCKAVPEEHTRLSNPACTLRSSGWNRWEWVCKNPQDKALVPFDFMINNRLVVKDNHRPCVQRPLNQDTALPPFRNDDTLMDYSKLGGACDAADSTLMTPSTTWKPCKYLDQYAPA